LIVVISLGAAVVLQAGRAHAALYWPNGFGLARSNADGSEFDDQFIEPDRTGPFVDSAGCQGVAVDASHLYWSEPGRGSIARANLDGSGVEYDFIAGLENPCGIAVDGTSIYWAEEKAEAIARANLNGGELDRSFIAGTAEPCGVAVGDGYVFWTTGHYLDRLSLSGGVPQRIYEGDESFDFCGVAVDATKVYWGGFGESIGRAGLDGSHPEPSFITGIERPCGIALQGSRIYWTRNFPPGAIQGTDLNGGHVAETVIDRTGGDPCGIAADSTTLTPPPPPPAIPSHVISFWHTRHGAHSPVTFIRIKFPQAGSFTVRTGPAVRWRILSGAAAAWTLLGPEERLLKVWPAAGSRSAKALRARLRRTGRAQVPVSVHFLAEDGNASTKRQWLFLLDRRHSRKHARMHHTRTSGG